MKGYKVSILIGESEYKRYVCLCGDKIHDIIKPSETQEAQDRWVQISHGMKR